MSIASNAWLWKMAIRWDWVIIHSIVCTGGWDYRGIGGVGGKYAMRRLRLLARYASMLAFAVAGMMVIVLAGFGIWIACVDILSYTFTNGHIRSMHVQRHHRSSHLGGQS